MSTNTATREGRIELRATKDEKRILAVAAFHERLDVTMFIMRTVLPAAREVFDRAERITLYWLRVSDVAGPGEQKQSGEGLGVAASMR
jgi:uncharacterized protein (DUF1778 family)